MQLVVYAAKFSIFCVTVEKGERQKGNATPLQVQKKKDRVVWTLFNQFKGPANHPPEHEPEPTNQSCAGESSHQLDTPKANKWNELSFKKKEQI